MASEHEKRASNYSPSCVLDTASDILGGKTDFDQERIFLEKQLSEAIADKNEFVAVPIIAVFRKHGKAEDVVMLKSYSEESTDFIVEVAQRAIGEIEARSQS